MTKKEEPERKPVRFEDEDEAYSAQEYQAISSTGANSVSEWELSNREQSAREDHESPQDDYWERQNTKKTVRDLGKGVRRDLQNTITRKGGDNRAQAGATAEIYEEMGGSPKPEGNRNRWSVRDLQRTAINEHMAKQHIDSKCKDRDRNEQRSSNQQRQVNDQIIKAAKDGARAGESLQNDPETGVSTNGWFSWLFGSHAEKSEKPESDSIQQELPLKDATPDPNREWTAGDVAKLFFLGGRDENIF